ncbi:MAG: DUF4405 domain-containing protein [Syntrophomonas sp.]
MVKKINLRLIRAVVAVLLIIFWLYSISSGFLLYFTKHTPGTTPILLGITRSVWKDLHFWLSVIALVITIVHIIIDWKALTASVRYLLKVNNN